MDLPLGGSLKELGVENDGGDGFVKGKGRVDSKKEEIEKEETDPVFAARKGSEDNRPGSKDLMKQRQNKCEMAILESC